MTPRASASADLAANVGGQFGTILADPPWQFMNRTGKMAPEHRRLMRYPTMKLDEIKNLPVDSLAADKSHLYLWVPNALLKEGLEVPVQGQPRLVQDPQRRRPGRTGRWLLLPQRHRAGVIWHAGKHPHC